MSSPSSKPQAKSKQQQKPPKQNNSKQKAPVEVVKREPQPQPFDYYVVLDFEATCEENNETFKNEIIEFPLVLINAKERKVEDSVRYFVKPEWNPKLTEFCTKLTGITQQEVDSGESLATTLKKVEQWLQSKRLLPAPSSSTETTTSSTSNTTTPFSFCIITDGPWDFEKFLVKECEQKGIAYPSYCKKWCDIRLLFSNFFKTRRAGINKMLEQAGMKFEGNPHSGLDDSKNLARIALYLVANGCILEANRTVLASTN